MSEWLAHLRALARPTPAWYAVIAAVCLTWVGIAAIQTADMGHSPPSNHAIKQVVWLGVGLIAMAMAAWPRPRMLGLSAIPLFAATLLLLTIIVLPFMPRAIVPVINGTRAWINLYFMQFQPSELGKVAFVLALAWYLRKGESIRWWHGLAIPFAATILTMALILLEPDLGTAMLFAPVLLALLLTAGAKLWHLSTIVLAGLLGVGLLIATVYLPIPEEAQILRSYQRDRIHAMVRQTFFDDDRFIQDVGYQQDRSQMLIGAGGADGYGLDRSATILRFNPLPEDHNDMIFAVIVNRWGLVGGLLVLALYLTMLGAMLASAMLAREPFTRLALVGFAALFFSQFVVNVGMAMGLLPIIGITLPFVSYGGSSLMMSYVILGLTLNFASRQPRYVMRDSLEFADATASEGSESP